MRWRRADRRIRLSGDWESDMKIKDAKHTLCPESFDRKEQGFVMLCETNNCACWVFDITRAQDDAGNYTNKDRPLEEQEGHCGLINGFPD